MEHALVSITSKQILIFSRRTKSAFDKSSRASGNENWLSHKVTECLLQVFYDPEQSSAILCFNKHWSISLRSSRSFSREMKKSLNYWRRTSFQRILENTNENTGSKLSNTLHGEEKKGFEIN